MRKNAIGQWCYTQKVRQQIGATNWLKRVCSAQSRHCMIKISTPQASQKSTSSCDNVLLWPNLFSVVERLTKSLNQPIPKGLEQIRGYYRYLTHKDNPEKAQYDEADIETINGFNISDFVELTKSEVNEIKRRLQRLIIEENIVEYSDFMDILLDMPTEYDVAASNTFSLMRTYQAVDMAKKSRQRSSR